MLFRSWPRIVCQVIRTTPRNATDSKPDVQLASATSPCAPTLTVWHDQGSSPCVENSIVSLPRLFGQRLPCQPDANRIMFAVLYRSADLSPLRGPFLTLRCKRCHAALGLGSVQNAELAIVGGFYAALNIAVSAPQHGYSESITILTDEDVLPHHRPPLSKGFLLGAIDGETLPLRGKYLYRDDGIEVIFGARIVESAKAASASTSWRWPQARGAGWCQFRASISMALSRGVRWPMPIRSVTRCHRARTHPVGRGGWPR